MSTLYDPTSPERRIAGIIGRVKDLSIGEAQQRVDRAQAHFDTMVSRVMRESERIMRERPPRTSHMHRSLEIAQREKRTARKVLLRAMLELQHLTTTPTA